MIRAGLLAAVSAIALSCSAPALASPEFNKGLAVGETIGTTISPTCKLVGCVLSVPTVTGATYQWNLGGSPIAGATSSAWTTAAPGSYTVTVTLNGISVTSPNTYIAQGVHFDPMQSALYTSGAATCTTNLTGCAGSPLATSSGAVPATPHFTMSYWVRGVPLLATTGSGNRGDTYGFLDHVSNIEVPGTNAEAFPAIDQVWDNGTTKLYRLNIGSTPQATGLQSSYNCNANISSLIATDWVHVVTSFDGTVSGSAKGFAAYVNGVQQGSGGCTVTANSGSSAFGGGEFDVGVNNPNGFGIVANINSNTTGKSTIDIADVFVDMHDSVLCTGNGTPATMYGMSVTCTAANTIPPQILAKFATNNGTGDPVDLGATCSNPLGNQPEICFTGGPTGWSAGNKGSANNTWVSQGLYATPTSPGSAGTPAHKPIPKGFYGESLPSGTSPFTTNTTGLPVKAGDMIFAYLKLIDSSGVTAHSLTCPTSSAGAFTLAGVQNSITSDRISTIVCYRIALADNESDVLTWTWGAASTRGGEWATGVIGQVNASPIVAENDTATTPVLTFTAPALAATGAGQMMLTLFDKFGGNSNLFSTPSGSSRVYTGVNTNMGLTINFDYTAGSGTTGTRAATLGSSDEGVAWSILINPN